MPTGYTAKLYDGEQTFEEFALTAARAMGVAVLLRDSPLGPIPDEFKANTDHHDRKIAETNEGLAALSKMTIADATRAAQREFDEAVARRDEDRRSRSERRQRYESMLHQVQEWTPPTAEHLNFKEFMVKQLTESISFDCSDFEFPLPTQDGREWSKQKRERLYKDLEYHTAERAKEVQRTKDRNAWVKALRSSLPTGSEEANRG